MLLNEMLGGQGDAGHGGQQSLRNRSNNSINGTWIGMSKETTRPSESTERSSKQSNASEILERDLRK